MILKKFISEIVEEAKTILNSDDTKENKAKKLSDIALKTVDIKEHWLLYSWKKRKSLAQKN